VRNATALLAATLVLLAARAQGELLEFDATLSIESLETLFPQPPGSNDAFGTLAPGHGVASVTSSGGITGFTQVSGLSGVVAVGDLGTDAIFDYWEIDVGGIGSPFFSGAPLHGSLALLMGDARRIVGFPLSTATTLTWFHTRSQTLGPGLGGTFTTAWTPSTTVRVEFGTWTTGMLTLTNLHPVPTGLTSPALTGFDARTAGGLGVLQMVTPIRINASPPIFRLGAFGVLRIEFLPEPASGVMLLSAVCFLLVLARHRIAKEGR
jgi:hypothetical protein